MPKTTKTVWGGAPAPWVVHCGGAGRFWVVSARVRALAPTWQQQTLFCPRYPRVYPILSISLEIHVRFFARLAKNWIWPTARAIYGYLRNPTASRRRNQKKSVPPATRVRNVGGGVRLVLGLRSDLLVPQAIFLAICDLRRLSVRVLRLSRAGNRKVCFRGIWFSALSSTRLLLLLFTADPRLLKYVPRVRTAHSRQPSTKTLRQGTKFRSTCYGGIGSFARRSSWREPYPCTCLDTYCKKWRVKHSRYPRRPPKTLHDLPFPKISASLMKNYPAEESRWASAQHKV